MPNPNRCCNSLGKEKHCRVYEKSKLLQITAKWPSAYGNLVVKFICSSWKSAAYKQFKIDTEKLFEIPYNDSDSRASNPDLSTDNIIEHEDDDDVSSESDDQSTKTRPDLKRPKESDFCGRYQGPAVKSRQKSLSALKPTPSWVEDLKSAIFMTTNRHEILTLLTTLPDDWGIKNISKTFGITRHTAFRTKKLRQRKAYGSKTEKKSGRLINSDVAKKVREFYVSDEVSHVMPGIRDYKSVKRNGKRQQETVNILLEFYGSVFFWICIQIIYLF